MTETSQATAYAIGVGDAQTLMGAVGLPVDIREIVLRKIIADRGTDADADRIAALFDPAIFEATVSVVCERSEGLPATSDHQRSLAVSFSSRLLQRGFNVRVFDPAGQDTIGGGCGQLWFVQQWMSGHSGLAKPSVGRGFPERHAPSTPGGRP